MLGTRDYVDKNGFDSVVLGLSGGIDSALTMCVAVDALAKARAHELRDVHLGAYRTNKLILRREAFEEGVRVANTLMSEAPKGNVFESIKR